MTNPLEGRVEVCVNHAWGSVCAKGFNDDDARVVCRSISGTGKFCIRQISSLLLVTSCICFLRS